MARLPRCGHTLDDVACTEQGDHFCWPRAVRVERFFGEALVHTKGQWARQRFILTDWQRDDIIHPLFGWVAWSTEREQYVRQHRLAWIELARKNGKSELDAGIALTLLVADDEEAAEVYGAAHDRDQARKVYDVAARMAELSPVLRKRLEVKHHAKRIIDPRTGSYYETVASDASGNLGHNPHGIIFDEVLTQRGPELWDALRTAMGARLQPLMVATTTAGNDPASFAARQHREMERIADAPDRAPHVFVFARNTPTEADPWDEDNWQHANPALGDFLSRQALRDEAMEARNDPAKENTFRQFRLNQWVQAATRWMPLHVWDASAGDVLLTPTDVDARMEGREAWGGLDLSTTTDVTALCWLLPDGDTYDVAWRFFLPSDTVARLDDFTGGAASVWVREGWLTATEGNVIDYDAVMDQVEADMELLRVAEVSYDRWMAEPIRQRIAGLGVEGVPVGQGFRGMSGAMKELMRLAQTQALHHHGNPVARWMADAVEVKQDPAENIKPIKPERDRSGRRIDGIVALAMALDGHMRRGGERKNYRAVSF